MLVSLIRDFRADEKLDARAAQLAKGGANETNSIMLQPFGGGEQAEHLQESGDEAMAEEGELVQQ